MTDQANTPTPSGADGVDERPVNPKLLIPKADGKLVEVCRLVAGTWGQETWLTLRWKTQADFAQLYQEFAQGIADKRQAAASRTPQSQRLQELDDEMDEKLRVLKSYVNEANDYDKARTDARLPGFGLVARSGGGFGLSRDRDERLVALRDLLLPAVAAAPFAGRPHGRAYWQQLYDEYKTLLEKTDGLAGKVTKSVSSKDAAKQELRKTLQAIVYTLRANFPDTYEAELRAWGFRKTSY